MGKKWLGRPVLCPPLRFTPRARRAETARPPSLRIGVRGSCAEFSSLNGLFLLTRGVASACFTPARGHCSRQVFPGMPTAFDDTLLPKRWEKPWPEGRLGTQRGLRSLDGLPLHSLFAPWQRRPPFLLLQPRHFSLSKRMKPKSILSSLAVLLALNTATVVRAAWNGVDIGGPSPAARPWSTSMERHRYRGGPRHLGHHRSISLLSPARLGNQLGGDCPRP